MASKRTGLAVLEAEAKEGSRSLLRSEYVYEGCKVYTIHRGSSASGLTHYFTVAVTGIDNTGEPALFNITYHVAKALGWTLTDRDGHRVIKVQGSGMDMGFHLVYSLSSDLFAGADIEYPEYALIHQSF